MATKAKSKGKKKAPIKAKGKARPAAKPAKKTKKPAHINGAAPVAAAPPAADEHSARGLDMQHGIIRPKPASRTGKVFAIADAISAKEKRPAIRAEVLKEAAKSKLAPGTVSTQYGRWRKFNGLAAWQR